MEYLYICVFSALALCSLAEESPAVKTKVGEITGLREYTDFQGKRYTVDRYLGIPYAKPPVGDLRFKKPQPHSQFLETFHAEKFGLACPQFDWMGLVQNTSEDCLFLNIFVPEQEPDQSDGHAVMVFMHGGAFSVGEAAMYPGDNLAAIGNVIVVTINYRLGLLGFLDLDDPRAPGNFGLWDQHQSLIWVNQNIGSFGGDINRVTIFGQSAGSVAVQYQSTYPENKNLFRGVIAQSGSMTMAQTITTPPNHKASGNFYAEKLGCNTDTVDQVLECLQKATSDSIIDVMKNAAFSGNMDEMMKSGLYPSIDGEFLKYHATDMYKRARTETLAEVEFLRSLKLMNGITGNDGMIHIHATDDMKVTRQEMNNQHIPSIVSLIYNTPIPEVVTELLISEYTDWKSPDDPVRLRDQYLNAQTDIQFKIPLLEFSQLHANVSDSDSYIFVFDALVDKHIVPSPSWMQKANHGDELAPVFGYHKGYTSTYIKEPDYTVPEWEVELSRRMMIHWSNFAKSGDPNEPVKSAQQWPKYNLNTQEYMIFDEKDSTDQYLGARELKLREILTMIRDELLHVKTGESYFKSQDKDEKTCLKDGDCDVEGKEEASSNP